MVAALCQIPLIWESARENILFCDDVLQTLFENFKEVDIVVFPEFFTTGFSMNEKNCEEGDGYSLKWMVHASHKYGCAIAASVPVKERGRCYNRAYFVTPSGNIDYYDKRHLFSYGGEDQVFSPGRDLTVVSYKGWNIALQICYDLRFPVYIRNRELKYDLVINMANWPSARDVVVDPLVRARAIENICYYAFVNRTGSDPQNKYNPVGFISDFKGNHMHPFLYVDEYYISLYTLDRPELNSFREKFRSWEDADNFKLEI